MNPEIERKVLDKTWFYRYRLPSGRETKSYDEGALDPIHATRLAMMDAELARAYPQGLAGLSAVDLACHQGYFTMALAQRGAARVVGVDARTEHCEDSRLIAQALGLANAEIVQGDVHRVDTAALGTHDVVLCFGLPILAGAIGAVASVSAPEFYAALERPSWSPPSWVFGPVWTVLYVLIAIAGWRAWTDRAMPYARTALALWGVQLVLNAAWSFVFFGLHRTGWALADIVLLLCAIAAFIAVTWRPRRGTALLFVPYFAWVAFATALNAAIWWMNRGG